MVCANKCLTCSFKGCLICNGDRGVGDGAQGPPLCTCRTGFSDYNGPNC